MSLPLTGGAPVAALALLVAFILFVAQWQRRRDAPLFGFVSDFDYASDI